MKDRELNQALEHLQQQPIKAPPYLAQRVLANLPDGEPMDRLWRWLSASWWRVSAATVLPLLVGFAVGLGNTPDADDNWAEAEALVFADALAEYEYDEI